jgi:hypothetical protein
VEVQIPEVVEAVLLVGDQSETVEVVMAGQVLLLLDTEET